MLGDRRVCHRNEGLERQKAIPQKKLENHGESREIAAGPGRGGSSQEQEGTRQMMDQGRLILQRRAEWAGGGVPRRFTP